MSMRADDAFDVLLPKPDRSPDSVTTSNAGDRPCTRSIRLPPHLYNASTRRLGCWQGSILSRISRGKPWFTAQAPLASCVFGTPPRAAACIASERSVGNGLRRRSALRRTQDQNANDRRSIYPRVFGNRGRVQSARRARRRGYESIEIRPWPSGANHNRQRI